jgi:hypothetical protein
LGSSESELLLRRVFDAPFSRSLCDDCLPVRLVARTILGTVTCVRGLPMYSAGTNCGPGMDEWLAGLGGFTTIPRGTSSSLSLLKAFVAIRRRGSEARAYAASEKPTRRASRFGRLANPVAAEVY